MSPLDRAPLPNRDEVALGAFLHDVGKFCQRSRSSLKSMPEEVRARASDVLPSSHGRSSHWHALWTDAFFDEVVDRNPLPKEIDARWVRDCAVYHHKPLQNGTAVPYGSVTWLVTEADRIASGMERKRRDAEQDNDPTGAGRDAYRKTLLTSMFAKVAIKQGVKCPENLRQPLTELRADRIDPVSRDSVIDPALPADYGALWNKFADEYRGLAARVGDDVIAFHEGILSLSERFMWAIPSSTIDEPDVGLHDHARAVAAVASCLHAHHEYARTLADEAAIRDREQHKFHFIIGDVSGIQTALFRLASEGARGIARVLRGRSLRIQLIGEAAARLCLSAFGLPPYCVLQNAGGRFPLLAPLTDAEQQHAELDRIRAEIDRWMQNQYQGDLVLNLAFTSPFAATDLLDSTRAKVVLSRIGQVAEETKHRPLTKARDALFSGKWDEKRGICSTCGVRPALETGLDELHRCPACQAETELGRAYPKAVAVVMDHRGIPDQIDNIFGLNIGLPSQPYPNRPALGWRFRGKPDDPNLPAADRFAGAYVPAHNTQTLDDPVLTRARRDAGETDEPREKDALTFAELAAISIENGKGRPMLAALKADVDRLGQIFTRGLGEHRSLARAAALSRMVDAFFTGSLPHRLQVDFPYVYTVYAGGDDLLLLGPWRDILRLASKLRDDFRRFVGGSPHVTLSTGIAFFDPKTPVTRAAHEAEQRLERAKEDGRDRVHAILATDTPALSWNQYAAALRDADELHKLINGGSERITTALLYKLLWVDSRRHDCEEKRDVRAADWRAKLGYLLWRALPIDEGTRAFLCKLMGVGPELNPLTGSDDRVPARVALSIAIYRNR
jgi:CRISPR-associated protein Csm1